MCLIIFTHTLYPVIPLPLITFLVPISPSNAFMPFVFSNAQVVTVGLFTGVWAFPGGCIPEENVSPPVETNNCTRILGKGKPC